MAKEKVDYTSKNESELQKLLEEKQKKLLDEKMNFAQRKVKDVHTTKKLRKDIARIKTINSLKKGRS